VGRRVGPDGRVLCERQSGSDGEDLVYGEEGGREDDGWPSGGC
jgi:hypothetical protein